MSRGVKKAIVPVAGFGTRFLPATKAQPKEMLPIVDKPVIQYIVEEIVNSGLKEIIFVTGRGKRSIEDHFDRSIELEYLLLKNKKKSLLEKIIKLPDIAEFSYVRQLQPLGNGEALLRAEHLIGNEPVAVVFGDELIFSKPPLISSLIKVFERYNDPVVALYKVPKNEAKNYGVIKGIKVEKNVYQIKEIVEKPRKNPPSDMIIIGQYIITKKIFYYIKKLAKIIKKKKSKEEIGLTDALGLYIKDGYPLYGYLFEGERYDCGNKAGFVRAVIETALKHPETKNEIYKYLKEKFG